MCVATLQTMNLQLHQIVVKIMELIAIILDLIFVHVYKIYFHRFSISVCGPLMRGIEC